MTTRMTELETRVTSMLSDIEGLQKGQSELKEMGGETNRRLTSLESGLKEQFRAFQESMVAQMTTLFATQMTAPFQELGRKTFTGNNEEGSGSGSKVNPVELAPETPEKRPMEAQLQKFQKIFFEAMEEGSSSKATGAEPTTSPTEKSTPVAPMGGNTDLRPLSGIFEMSEVDGNDSLTKINQVKPNLVVQETRQPERVIIATLGEKGSDELVDAAVHLRLSIEDERIVFHSNLTELEPLGPPPWSTPKKQKGIKEATENQPRKGPSSNEMDRTLSDLGRMEKDAIDGLLRRRTGALKMEGKKESAISFPGGEAAARVARQERSLNLNWKTPPVSFRVMRTRSFGSEVGRASEPVGPPPWPILSSKFYNEFMWNNGPAHNGPGNEIGKTIHAVAAGVILSLLQPPELQLIVVQGCCEQVCFSFHPSPFDPPRQPSPDYFLTPFNFAEITNSALFGLSGRTNKASDDPGEGQVHMMRQCNLMFWETRPSKSLEFSLEDKASSRRVKMYKIRRRISTTGQQKKTGAQGGIGLLEVQPLGHPPGLWWERNVEIGDESMNLPWLVVVMTSNVEPRVRGLKKRIEQERTMAMRLVVEVSPRVEVFWITRAKVFQMRSPAMLSIWNDLQCRDAHATQLKQWAKELCCASNYKPDLFSISRLYPFIYMLVSEEDIGEHDAAVTRWSPNSETERNDGKLMELDSIILEWPACKTAQCQIEEDYMQLRVANPRGNQMMNLFYHSPRPPEFLNDIGAFNQTQRIDGVGLVAHGSDSVDVLIEKLLYTSSFKNKQWVIVESKKKIIVDIDKEKWGVTNIHNVSSKAELECPESTHQRYNSVVEVNSQEGRSSAQRTYKTSNWKCVPSPDELQFPIEVVKVPADWKKSKAHKRRNSSTIKRREDGKIEKGDLVFLKMTFKGNSFLGQRVTAEVIDRVLRALEDYPKQWVGVAYKREFLTT